MLRQIEWGIQKEPFVKSWFDIQTTQMSIFILLVSTGVILEGAFSLWVSLMAKILFPLSLPALLTTLRFNGVIETRGP